ncbi:hypothetical protein BUALT_Bualt13G0051600 [Buddleja alternifolia]|uniref:RING-type E3 ubiquitin transferase n=1 Tax=Buddleja alternifolia TaxID=168488 RepID=A0AAV6WK43_9LAMI|nr:hypothetical protein BUALT_Bualt13G0051600 [Buddleja alternifolia]
MEEGQVSENHLTSAAAFVEGGIQEACDDSCSICLEDFCDSDPSTLTSCKHEYHLQCILEWCQRSSQCPMCWQPISLKDPSSQELLDGVVHERNVRMNPPRNTTIFHHPTLGDFELQHLPVSASESELEERIIQHLAAAAAMGRARQLARRENQRNRTSTQGRPHYLVFSTSPNGASAPSNGPNSPFITVGEDSGQHIGRPSAAQADQHMTSGSSAGAYHYGTSSSNRRSPAQTSPVSQDRAGPSDLQSFSDSLKSRLSALSMRYKDSITKSTRGWKERLFARNNSTPDEVHRDVDQGIATGEGIATVSRMMDHLEIAEDSRTNIATASNNSEYSTTPDLTERQTTETGGSPSLDEDDMRAPPAVSSASN